MTFKQKKKKKLVISNRANYYFYMCDFIAYRPAIKILTKWPYVSDLKLWLNINKNNLSLMEIFKS